MLKRIYRMLELPADVYMMEYLLMAVSLWWAFVFLFPFGTFAFGINGNFEVLAKIAGPSFWGVVSSFLSGWLLVGLVMRWVLLRRTILFLHFLWWFLIAYTVTGGNIRTTGIGVYVCLGLAALYMAIYPKVYQPYIKQQYLEQRDEWQMDEPQA